MRETSGDNPGDFWPVGPGERSEESVPLFGPARPQEESVPLFGPGVHVPPGPTGRIDRRRRRGLRRLGGQGDGHSGATNPESDPPVLEQGSGPALGEEAAAFVTDSFQAFAQFFAKTLADAHGLGVPFRVVEWVYGALKWKQVAESGGGADLQAPLPLGPALVLDVSVHLGGDPDTPPVTFCIAPSGVSGVGAVALGRLELDPAPSRDDVNGDRIEVPQAHPGPMMVVPLRLSQAVSVRVPRLGPEGLEAARLAAFARQMAEQELLPGLLQRREMLHDAGVDFVLGCDFALGLAVWVDLRDADRPSELRLGVRPGAADLEMKYDPVTGLGMWLGLMDAKRRFPPAVIRHDGANRLEVAVPLDARAQPSEPVVSAEGTTRSTPGRLSPVRATDGVAGRLADLSRGQAAGMTSMSMVQSAAEMPVVRLTRLAPVPVAAVWRDLALWLFQSGPLLSDMLGIDIELESGEYKVGILSVDILGHELTTGNPVVIKSQYGPVDYDYLGQILRYADAVRPVTIVWVAEEFLGTQLWLDRLNEHTDPAIRFFGLRLGAVTLDGAPVGLIAPYLELVIKPD